MSIRLEDLVDVARKDAAARARALPEERLEALLREQDAFGREPGRLRRQLRGGTVAVIAEVKAASPLSGPLRDDFDPVRIARRYEEAGAAALSVLTEARHFGGSLDHLRAVRDAVGLPLLRKDFVTERYQVLEAAAAGAAAVLLIADVLEPRRLRELVEAAHAVGLDALVEVHDADSVPAVAAAGSGLVGVNNRDLRSMQVDVEHCVRVAHRLPDDWVKVAESGVEDRRQLARIEAAGYDAALVGSSLMRAPDPGRALAGLLDGRDAGTGGDS